jgi:hypothetical protein
VRKEIARKSDPVDAVVNYLKQYPAEMIVLATHQRRGRLSWLTGSVAEPIARRATEKTLFIAAESQGFISADDGSVSLENILIPVAPTPRPTPAIEAAARSSKACNAIGGPLRFYMSEAPGRCPPLIRPRFGLGLEQR